MSILRRKAKGATWSRASIPIVAAIFICAVAMLQFFYSEQSKMPERSLDGSTPGAAGIDRATRPDGNQRARGIANDRLPVSRPMARASGRTASKPGTMAARVSEFAAALRSYPPQEVERFLREFATSLEGSEVDAIFDRLLAEVPVELRARVVEARIMRWAEIDPESVASALIETEPNPGASELLGRVLAQWGRDDWVAAVAWARALPDRADKNRIMLGLGPFWDRADPEGAAQYVQNLPSSEERTRLMTTLAAHWVDRDPPAAVAWVNQLPRDSSRDQILSSLVTAWAQRDEVAATEFVLHLPPGPAQQNAAISVISAWTAKDPGFAAQWAEAFPVGPMRAYAIENVLYRWAQFDPAAAAAWIARVPPSADRDTAINAGAGGLIHSRPDLAVEWAAMITDEVKRNRQMERAARRWLETDPQAARAWIAQSALPPNRKVGFGR